MAITVIAIISILCYALFLPPRPPSLPPALFFFYPPTSSFTIDKLVVKEEDDGDAPRLAKRTSSFGSKSSKDGDDVFD